MRNKLIKLLRELEKRDNFKNDYIDFDEGYQCNYVVSEILKFPNYRVIIKENNEKYPIKTKTGLLMCHSENGIKAELKRMEADDLIMIGIQTIKKYAFIQEQGKGPDYEDGFDGTVESIVLTTKGKSIWRYFLHKITENIVATVFSAIAIVISIISLVV